MQTPHAFTTLAAPHSGLARRRLLTTLPLLAAALAAPRLVRAATGTSTAVEVWKDPSCGCCKDWVEHMQANGFKVTVHDTGNNAVRSRLGLPQKLGSCHTALVGGYLLEGHVPASDVRALLQQKPKALGLAVPGMPVGSPGMDGAVYGNRRDPYDVLLVARDGSTRVFKSYNQKAAS
ncbi:Twin-arginine translocation pathway signal [Acidovorax sp. SRB_14]|uniref:DUF411 domain-containing protein n=1 Tax=unclassified Acidovorax TaxID=2684926 RepID=UPI00145D656E|nr:MULTISPECIES: DUF411 domain-containing protein [unclassified Acidovorax]NMM77480.1 Twin-arginine translocation pathway signal [Acidovorax sp. SRB_24]NMM82327.1 Twin-arginine translocation pathway signal [Acidovorax sp. SRB_14]NMM90329.1 Twin-arginine translocation pathway signal [Rhodococcus sp. SRB_17]